MEALKQKPVFALDHEARKQIRETRATILEHLETAPNDLKALVFADVLGEIDPDRDATLAAHRMRFRATRAADWKLRAHELGLDRLLLHLSRGMAEARIGHDAVPVLERYAYEISEATSGRIDASYVPERLANDPRVAISYHPNGHLAKVSITIDALHNGELQLDARRGSGHYTIVEMRGGSGTMIQERYRNGGVVTTLNTPWHDGEESIDKKPWTLWVQDNLGDLERLATIAPTPRRKRKRQR